MTANSRRKWRWSSKGIFGPKALNKRTIHDRSSEDADSTINPSTVVDMSLDSSSSQKGPTGSKLPSKKHRNNSKFLSAVGIQRNGGNIPLISGALKLNDGQAPAPPINLRVTRASEMLPWPLSGMPLKPQARCPLAPSLTLFLTILSYIKTSMAFLERPTIHQNH